jgi:phage gp16-like protein
MKEEILHYDLPSGPDQQPKVKEMNRKITSDKLNSLLATGKDQGDYESNYCKPKLKPFKVS